MCRLLRRGRGVGVWGLGHKRGFVCKFLGFRVSHFFEGLGGEVVSSGWWDVG